MKFIVLFLTVLALVTTGGAQQAGQTVLWGDQVIFGHILPGSDSLKIYGQSDYLYGADTVYTAAINYDAIDGVTKFAFYAEPVTVNPDSYNVDFRLGHVFKEQVEASETYVKFEAWQSMFTAAAGSLLYTWRFNASDSIKYSPADFIQFKVANIDTDTSKVFLKEYVK